MKYRFNTPYVSVYVEEETGDLIVETDTHAETPHPDDDTPHGLAYVDGQWMRID